MLIVFICSVHRSLPQCRRLANFSRLPRRLLAPTISCAKLLRFSRLANGLLRVLHRPVIAQRLDRALSRSPPSHELCHPNSMLWALLTRLFAASTCARASLAMPAMKCYRKSTLYQRLLSGSEIAQLHFRTTPPPCTRASRSALKPVSFARRAPSTRVPGAPLRCPSPF